MIRSSRRWVVLLACCALAAGCVGSSLEARRGPLPMGPQMAVDVRPVTAPEPGLLVSVTNGSTREQTFSERSLPWKGASGLTLIAVKDGRPGTVLERMLAPDEPGAGAVTLRPGETLSGSLPLIQRFPGLREALAERDVLVFWSYRFEPLGQEPPRRIGGFVVLPRAGSGARAEAPGRAGSRSFMPGW